MAVVTSVSVKDLHCSPDSFWKSLRNNLALSANNGCFGSYMLQVFGYQNSKLAAFSPCRSVIASSIIVKTLSSHVFTKVSRSL